MNQQSQANHQEPMTIGKFLALMRFTFNDSWIPILLAVLAIILFLASFAQFGFVEQFKQIWGDHLDPSVSFVTLIVALFVWYSEITDKWEQSLPKKLTIEFMKENGELVLLCVNASLPHEADIRNLGQQIGSQMCGDRNLQFCAPSIELIVGKVCHTQAIGFYRHFCVRFTFTTLPDNLLGLSSGQYKIWESPFTANDLKIVDRNPCRAVGIAPSGS